MDGLFHIYDEMVEAGVPKEDARFVLPYCFKSNFYCTLNARELEKVMNEMIFGRGREYPELAALGRQLYRQCEEILPYLKEEKISYEGVDELLADVFSPGKESGSALMEYISGPDNAEELICRAAALNHGLAGDASLLTDEKKKEILQKLLQGGRKRELEQAHFTIRFNRISLAGVTHLVRHRMQSIVVPDYSKVYDFSKYVLPKSIMESSCAAVYEEVFQKTEALLSEMLADGMYEKDSVYFLLSGMTIPVVTTMNANELETFMRLRTCNRAQWEIKACADALLVLLREKHPVLFSLYGPACYMLGFCPEGRMTCEKKEEMELRYRTNQFERSLS
jgi:thymidylate synthase (FAD)